MKKLFLLSLLGVTAFGTQAQTAKKAQLGLVTKISATWCGPCGSWGWTAANDLISATHDNAMYIGVFPDNSTSWATIDFYNSTAASWGNAWPGGGYPSFGANALDKSAQNTQNGGVDVNGTKADVVAAIDAFAAANTVASTGYTFKLDATTKKVTVSTKTKFWEAANGTYYVGAYMIEDGAMHSQNGQTTQTGKTAHHEVLRGSMSTTWGDQIATGAVAANAEFTKDFTFTITDAKWDLAKMKVVTIIWKKNGTKYEYVNGSNKWEFPTSVNEVANNMANFVVYPNPATDRANVSIDMNKPSSVTINVTDAMGRTVHTSGAMQFGAGMNGYVIPTANLAAGMYNVAIASEGGVITQRLAVTK